MAPEPAAVGNVLLGLIACLLAVATLAALLPVSRGNPHGLSLGLSAGASVAIVALGVLALVAPAPLEARFGDVLGFALVAVRIDGLAGLFLLMLGAVGAAASIFAVGYTGGDGHGSGPTASPVQRDRTAAALPAFLLSLGLVFASADAVAFLLAWEVMALSSAVLVVGSRPTPAVARAGYVYLALTHLATAALIVAFGILAATSGSTDLAGFGAAAAGLPGPGRDALFVLFVIGFGTKAGAIPFHIWLPRAHPVAPSHVSALMSGVLVKAGVFGLVRFGLEILGPGPAWWGLALLAIGLVSAILGALYALMENDLKRLLAFSTIENVGIILIGLAVAVLASGRGIALLGTLALTAALVHALNHSLFKAALFLAAGSVGAAAGTRDLNRLGGLARVMPVTALVFVLGAAAISGLPPLNGFTGEWLTFGALLAAGADIALSPLVRSAVLVAVAGLGLTAALAVATFVKASGVGFLALPRSEGAATARETSRSMGAGMAILAVACIVAAVGAGPLVTLVGSVAGEALGTHGATLTTAGPLAVSGAAGSPGYAAAPVALLLVLVTALAWAAGRRGRTTRRVPTWTCGIVPDARFSYTSASYAKLVRLYFGGILRHERELTVELHPGTPFPRTVRYRGGARHVLDERVYAPLHRTAVGAAQLARRLQSGSLQLYLAYTVTAVVILLVLAR